MKESLYFTFTILYQTALCSSAKYRKVWNGREVVGLGVLTGNFSFRSKDIPQNQTKTHCMVFSWTRWSIADIV